MIASVMCLQQVLNFIANQNENVTYGQAMAYCGGISICVFFLSLHHHWVYYNTSRIGINVRQAMTAAILYKALRISPNSVPSAQVINLMSTDCQRFQELLKMSAMPIVSVPFSIIGTFFLCYRINSWYPLLGLASIFALLSI